MGSASKFNSMKVVSPKRTVIVSESTAKPSFRAEMVYLLGGTLLIKKSPSVSALLTNVPGSNSISAPERVANG